MTLENEALLGRQASHAYDTYLEGYIALLHANFYTAFKTADDVEMLTGLSYKLKALASLEQAIKTDIETGFLAQQQLNLEK